MSFTVTSVSSNSHIKITHPNGTIVEIKNFKTLEFSTINNKLQTGLLHECTNFPAKIHGDVIRNFFRKFGELKQLTILPFSQKKCKVIFAYEDERDALDALE